MSQEFLTVSELNNFIRDVLASGFPRALWICGEVQGYDRGKDKKHIFFELCEKNPGTQEIVARTGLVIFANTRPKIEAILSRAENAFALKDDIEVKFLCKVDFYPGHGQVRLIVESIDPIHTLGKIAQDRQRLIAALSEKGVLQKNKRLIFPRVPLRIGLITSYDSAAYHDFMDELKRSRYGFKVLVMNTLMQGKNAPPSVVKALGKLNTADLDLIVVTRGGGSIAELSCFDSEAIALAIAESRLPVVSGIGHEINTTITDLAAHTFAKTPTAVAQMLVFRVQEFLGHVDEKYAELTEAAGRQLREGREGLKSASLQMRHATLNRVQTYHHTIVRLIQGLKHLPMAVIRRDRQTLLQYPGDLKKTIYLRLQNSRVKMSSYGKLVEMADPKKVLKRGFSITRSADGKAVRSVAQAKQAGVLTTTLLDGLVVSTVQSVTKETHDT